MLHQGHTFKRKMPPIWISTFPMPYVQMWYKLPPEARSRKSHIRIGRKKKKRKKERGTYFCIIVMKEKQFFKMWALIPTSISTTLVRVSSFLTIFAGVSLKASRPPFLAHYHLCSVQKQEKCVKKSCSTRGSASTKPTSGLLLNLCRSQNTKLWAPYHN